MRRTGLLVMLVVTLTACSSSNGSGSAGGDEDPPIRAGYSPEVEATACLGELAVDPTITCGFLLVPEDREQPEGRQVRLFVTRLPSRTTPAAPDPVVVLQGGPGDNADASAFVDHPLRDDREVIVLDQRGTGESLPSLACPEVAEDERARLALDLDDDGVVEAARAAVQTCRDRLTAEGIGLDAYDSAANAADVADLRVALDIDAWNLAGNSYGSRLALTVVRDHPEGVRSVALSGPYPPNVDEPSSLAAGAGGAFSRLFEACAADAACRAVSPDLRATFESLVTTLEESPVTAQATDSEGRPGAVRLDGDRLPALLFGALYETQLIPALPGVLEQLARGEGSETIGALVLDRQLDPSEFSHGMYLSVHCQDELALSKAGELTDQERETDYLRTFARAREIERAQCEAWDVGSSPSREGDAVRSDVPVLILVGEYDPTTPPDDGRLAAETLPNSYLYVLPGIGHDATALECPRLVRNLFFADPDVDPAHPCLEALGPPQFGAS